ncbi:nicotinate-nucleotide adenylyltransferase-like protein, putative [Theileria annulata]|uniref:Nicotinate-nucleotide adenylyltransferase-like protein, putative n=1 Tax=Theileria annulata TaxID=5874 RepID=Q4UBD9_THEAN|nr:nicotinate-nucleotide adenylyltransferase-like protein, putative [Theileria annulata]CAI75862.1 nicotinate-nucleotide adenylyltransferase-like protein, putative [Theileria annulata]|eukprot:XP_955338.1 nicotinate-nucleotide adenylyltransferase-like protein, putative [Theileria annulata]
MSAMTNVLLFCGAFDPITTGHMIMLDLCIKTNFFSEIRIMPSGKRTDKQYKVTDEHRTEMCKIAIDLFKKEYSNVNISISDYELNLTKNVDTYFTMKHFNETETDKNFYFFMGSDILPQMFDWLVSVHYILTYTYVIIVPYSDELIKIAHFLIAYREDFKIKQEDLDKLQSYKLLDKLLEDQNQQTQTSSASSTEARNNLKNGHVIHNLTILSSYILNLVM